MGNENGLIINHYDEPTELVIDIFLSWVLRCCEASRLTKFSGPACCEAKPH